MKEDDCASQSCRKYVGRHHRQPNAMYVFNAFLVLGLISLLTLLNRPPAPSCLNYTGFMGDLTFLFPDIPKMKGKKDKKMVGIPDNHFPSMLSNLSSLQSREKFTDVVFLCRGGGYSTARHGLLFF